MDYFIFNNVSSANYGLELVSSTHLTIAAKKIEEIEDEKFEKDIDKDIQDKKELEKEYEYAQKF